MFLITLLLVHARNAIGQNLCVGRLFLPFNFLSGIYTFAPNTLSCTKVVDRLNTGVLNDRHWILITPFNMPIMASWFAYMHNLCEQQPLESCRALGASFQLGWYFVALIGWSPKCCVYIFAPLSSKSGEGNIYHLLWFISLSLYRKFRTHINLYKCIGSLCMEGSRQRLATPVGFRYASTPKKNLKKYGREFHRAAFSLSTQHITQRAKRTRHIGGYSGALSGPPFDIFYVYFYIYFTFLTSFGRTRAAVALSLCPCLSVHTHTYLFWSFPFSVNICRLAMCACKRIECVCVSRALFSLYLTRALI